MSRDDTSHVAIMSSSRSQHTKTDARLLPLSGLPTGIHLVDYVGRAATAHDCGARLALQGLQ